MCPEARDIAVQANLVEPEILIVYPARLTPGKQFEKVTALAGAIRRTTEKTVKVVFCDFPCADISPQVYKTLICTEGKRYGLADGDLLFTSDLGYPDGFPRQGVLDLFCLSNLYLCPSRSESFGLTVLEAGSRGNFLVLNEAVPALRELGQQLGAYFMRWDARNFGFDTREKYTPSEEAYYQSHAQAIVNSMREDQSLRAATVIRNRYHPDWIWKNQLLPLLKG